MTTLDPDARAELLRIARAAIRAGLEGHSYRPPRPAHGALEQPRGAFVTVRRGGALRGCIGNFEARGPLYRTVAEMARAAAFEDSRFPPLTREEYPEISLEISALTPLERILDPEAVTVGRHGLYLVGGGRRGVLLPQVATEWGWDRVTFLEQTCRKAGLAPDAWRSGCELYVFEAEVFGEEPSDR